MHCILLLVMKVEAMKQCLNMLYCCLVNNCTKLLNAMLHFVITLNRSTTVFKHILYVSV
jgi:hypothetical protein